MYNSGGRLGRTTNPKPYQETLTQPTKKKKKKKKNPKENPRWYAYSHPKLATPLKWRPFSPFIAQGGRAPVLTHPRVHTGRPTPHRSPRLHSLQIGRPRFFCIHTGLYVWIGRPTLQAGSLSHPADPSEADSIPDSAYGRFSSRHSPPPNRASTGMRQ
jgi:hypothetical protein